MIPLRAASSRLADSPILRFAGSVTLVLILAASPCRLVAASVTGAADLSPTANSTTVCPDTPLRLTFDAPPSRGAGKIQVFDAAENKLVEAIDVTVSTRTKTIGGLPNFVYYPIIITGNQAAIYLNTPLAYNHTYYVTIDAGAFKTADGDFPGITDPNAWRFTTKAAPPAAGADKLTIAADGSGDFATVQAALDFIPDGNSKPVTLFIKKGTYNEIVFFTNKHAITILGEDRKQTIIAYPNNANFSNNAGGNPFANGATPTTATLRTGSIYHRGMLLAHRCRDITIANLTLHNTTPRGGSQAEALILNGTPDAHAIVTGVDLVSFQDTLQINGQAYVSDSYVEGDVDFMWGTGPVFFDNCRCTSTRSRAYYTQIRNPPTNHGYIYSHCTFDGTAGITDDYLSRIEPVRFPASEVVLLDCTLTSAVGGSAWLLNGATAAPNVHFWESNSRDPQGQPVDTAARAVFSRQLKPPDDKETIANYSDPTWVLGGKWTPKLAPVIAAQPIGATVAAGQPATLTVQAVAVPQPTYRWQKDGNTMAGGTTATLSIPSASPADNGIYTVIVSNSAGQVTSMPATLTVKR